MTTEIQWEWTCGANGQSCDAARYDHFVMLDASQLVESTTSGSASMFVVHMFHTSKDVEEVVAPFQASTSSAAFAVDVDSFC